MTPPEKKEAPRERCCFTPHHPSAVALLPRSTFFRGESGHDPLCAAANRSKSGGWLRCDGGRSNNRTALTTRERTPRAYSSAETLLNPVCACFCHRIVCLCTYLTQVHPEVMLTDTVGFIQKLPTNLVAAFRATLEEVRMSTLQHSTTLPVLFHCLWCLMLAFNVVL